MLLRWHLLYAWRHVVCIFRARAIEDFAGRADIAPLAAVDTVEPVAVDTAELALHTAHPGDTAGIEGTVLMVAAVDSQQEGTVLAACLAGLRYVVSAGVRHQR